MHDGKPLNNPESQVKLVFSDGCRDPAYSTLAPASPWRQDVNALVNNFDFRVFMFEDMQSGDSIIITAKVKLVFPQGAPKLYSGGRTVGNTQFL